MILHWWLDFSLYYVWQDNWSSKEYITLSVEEFKELEKAVAKLAKLGFTIILVEFEP